jgi:hypothetical protein
LMAMAASMKVKSSGLYESIREAVSLNFVVPKVEIMHR